MKRILCFLTAALMLFTVAGCGGATEDDIIPANPETETAEEEIPDYEGFEFVFRTAYMKNFLPGMMSEGVTDVISDYQQKQFDDAAKKYNCTITPVSEDAGALASKMKAQAATGTFDTDFVYSEAKNIRDWYKAGYLYDLRRLDNVGIDLTDTAKWGSEARRTISTYTDGAVFAIPYIGSAYWPQYFNYEGALLVNNELTAQVDTSTPYELYENKRWTFDTFKEILPAYTITEDNKTSVYALTLYDCNNPILAYSAVGANGGSFINSGENGYKFDLGSDKAFKALEWANEIYSMADSVKSSLEYDNTYFSDGNSVMYLTNAWRGLSTQNPWEIQLHLKNVSWMPFPYGPDAEYGKAYSGFYTTGIGITALIDGDKPKETAVVYNEIFGKIEELGENGYLDYLREYYFHNDESFEIYLNEFSNASMLRSDLLSEKGVLRINAVLTEVLRGVSTPAEAADKLTDSMQANIDAALEEAATQNTGE